jgi:hypothetical protein
MVKSILELHLRSLRLGGGKMGMGINIVEIHTFETLYKSTDEKILNMKYY